MKDYKDITIVDINGRTLYFPRDYQFIRYAPGAVRKVATNLMEARAVLEEENKKGGISPQSYEKLKKVLNQKLPIEEKFLMGGIVELHNAIEELIKNN